MFAAKLKILRNSKYILLAQEVGAQSLRILSFRNGLDENFLEYLFWFKTRHYLKFGTNLGCAI